MVAVLLLLIVPLAEILVILGVKDVIGGWWTLGLLVAESVLGAVLVKREGRTAWTALRQALASGRMPAGELADAALILVGGTLLFLPGFLTDILGFLFVLPFTRSLARRLLSRVIARRLLVVAPAPSGFPPARDPRGAGGAGRAGSGSSSTSGDDDIIEGEIL